MNHAKTVRLSELVSINPHSRAVAATDEVSFVAMSDLTAEGRIVVTKSRRFRDVAVGYTQFEEGDVLVAKITPCFENGKGAIARNLKNNRGAGSTEFHVLRPTQAIDARYLDLICRTSHFRKSGEACMEGSAGQKRIPAGFIKNYHVFCPPIPTQQKIADILTTWEEALKKLDSLIDATDRRKKALMQQLLTGKKRFPAFGKRPWIKVPMNELLQRVFRPINWTPDMALSLVSLRRRCGGLFRRPDVIGSDYKTQDLHELKANDFLISKRQVAHGAWGFVTPEFAGSHVSKEYAILVNTAAEKLFMPFFAWLSQTPRMIRLSRVASTGVHIEKLIFDPEVFLRDSIRIPSDIEEQRQISAILDTAEQQLILLRAQRTALNQQKRGMMQRLLTSKLRVKTLTSEESQ
jgi:type I restriction enzyme S subunit